MYLLFDTVSRVKNKKSRLLIYEIPIFIGDIIKKPTLLSNVACRRESATSACQEIIYKKRGD